MGAVLKRAGLLARNTRYVAFSKSQAASACVVEVALLIEQFASNVCGGGVDRNCSDVILRPASRDCR